MNEALKRIIVSNFPKENYHLVLAKLETINLGHVMANSQTNLDNTWLAILTLCKGDLNRLSNLVDSAK